jgi:hypothetical protein
MDERLAAGREHRFVLTNYTKRKEKKKTTAVTTIINHRDNFPKYYTMRIPFSFSKKTKHKMIGCVIPYPDHVMFTIERR